MSLRYVAQRVLWMLPTLFGAAVLVFIIMRVIPGDVAVMILGGESGVIDPKQLEVVREQLGLKDPLTVQLSRWLWGVAHLDFGRSLYTGEPVMKDIARKLPLTAEIALLATVLSAVVAIPLGVLAAHKQDSGFDRAILLLTIASLGAPSFWVGIILIVAFILVFNWSPPLGYISLFERPWENLQILALPTLAIGIRTVAVGVRLTRASMLEVLRQDYVRTARAKGLDERIVLLQHALKNALLPVITLLGLEFGAMFGGLTVTETVFSVAGLGPFLVQSVAKRDYPVVEGIVLTMTAIVMCVNLLIDLSYSLLDPRIRLESGA
jgi:peptide/nickel transport system permease protein